MMMSRPGPIASWRTPSTSTSKASGSRPCTTESPVPTIPLVTSPSAMTGGHSPGSSSTGTAAFPAGAAPSPATAATPATARAVAASLRAVSFWLILLSRVFSRTDAGAWFEDEPSWHRFQGAAVTLPRAPRNRWVTGERRRGRPPGLPLLVASSCPELLRPSSSARRLPLQASARRPRDLSALAGEARPQRPRLGGQKRLRRLQRVGEELHPTLRDDQLGRQPLAFGAEQSFLLARLPELGAHGLELLHEPDGGFHRSPLTR